MRDPGPGEAYPSTFARDRTMCFRSLDRTQPRASIAVDREELVAGHDSALVLIASNPA